MKDCTAIKSRNGSLSQATANPDTKILSAGKLIVLPDSRGSGTRIGHKLLAGQLNDPDAAAPFQISSSCTDTLAEAGKEYADRGAAS